MSSEPDPRPARPFALDLLILVAGIGLIAYLLALFTGIPMSTTMFFAAVICLVVAVVPIFTEVGGNTRAGIRARREGKVPREVIAALEKEGKYARGTRLTFLFGLGGIICFILSLFA